MKTTRYFDEQVRRKRPYIRLEWCEAALLEPVKRVVQDDGRIRIWLKVRTGSDEKTRALRVVLLEDGETVHNAFFDRDFEG